MTAKKRNRLVVVMAIALGVCVLVIGDLAVQRAQALPDDTYKELQTFANVIAISQKKYVKPVSTKDLINGAITVIRDVIRIDSVKAKDLKEGYDYIRISTFQDGSDSDLEHSLEKFRKAGHGHIKGLVLDLRDNPGGLLNQAVSIGDDLLDGGL